jgi:hypothetical protein
VFRSHKQLVSMQGRVVEMQVLPGKSAPHPKLFIIELQPEDSAPMRAEIKVRPGSSEYSDLYFSTNRVAGFLVNPATQEAHFDMSDPRNTMSAHTAATDAWAQSDDDSVDGSGPPWLVPGSCPSCHKKIDQLRTSMENQPHCAHCLHPLPAFPLVEHKHHHKHKNHRN